VPRRVAGARRSAVITRPAVAGSGRSRGYRDPVPSSLVELPGVADAVQAARTAVAEVHRHPANRRGWPRTAAAASVRAARASAVLDGGSGVLDAEAETVADPVLAGSLRVAAAVGRLSAMWQQAPAQGLAQLHLLAASGLPGPGELGRPASGDASGRLAGLARVIADPPWPAPVLVGVVHGELLAGRLFGSADGVVARAAARLTMISTGLDPRGLTVPEVGHLRSGPAYLELAGGYRSGDPAAVAAWLIEVCRCLEAGSREALSIAESAS
jgi:hypothetical protein